MNFFAICLSNRGPAPTGRASGHRRPPFPGGLGVSAAARSAIGGRGALSTPMEKQASCRIRKRCKCMFYLFFLTTGSYFRWLTEKLVTIRGKLFPIQLEIFPLATSSAHNRPRQPVDRQIGRGESGGADEIWGARLGSEGRDYLQRL